MLDRVETANSLTEIAGVRIEFIKRGTGRPLLLLHPAIGIKSTDRVIEELMPVARTPRPRPLPFSKRAERKKRKRSPWS